ncbi:methylthioribose-1-phosphate isomerase [Cryptosporangium arvum]|uniref:Putative translation initiation factor 2B subunit, eIF-2B alpha/beta/delta family n=1 Tax=Cryptosporangium arvum DSM 44712 TaxID=927661 RepID=A0A010ZRG8_9ACTN|nr:methylthioribose-1-phosphate isomerase [Cryptosporangium arvum]EXG79777.1 putative translation initiation factor 2B subunit, eIF-2B alpha/beta/delta family [Cryptosporangium arvum DSM 44712]
MRPVLDDSVRLTDEGVLILDRRVFPAREEWVLTRTAGEVAVAIRAMVTQSSGPFYAGLAGLRLSARLHRGDGLDTALQALADDGELLTAARPTNNHVRDAVREVLDAVGAAGSADELAELVEAETARLEAAYRGGSAELGRLTTELIPDGARVMTHCWMDAYLIGLVQQAELAGRKYEWVVTETRPYLQGARLTAHTLAEMGQPLTLITDSTAASVLAGQGALGSVDALVTAADRVTMDGHVINKVGTLSHAVAASAFEVPFYALVLAPDRTAATASDVVIEERDGAEVLSTLGSRTASALVERGYYPAFDVTPPEFVRRIVTDRGVFEPARVGEYHERQNR